MSSPTLNTTFDTFNNETYAELTTRYEANSRSLWFAMQPQPRPCFTWQLLRDIQRFQMRTKDRIQHELASEGEASIDYLVFCSNNATFNLGGDLNLFVDLIRQGDRQALAEYAHLSIEVLYDNYRNLDQPVTTVSLLQGDALGAGLESALSSDVIIAEKGTHAGFPEVVFNMFPGMGAYSFITRRLSASVAEQMITSGRIYPIEELHEMGVVDVLAEPGEGVSAFNDFVRRHRRYRNTYTSLAKMRRRVQPVDFSELSDIVDMWLDSAMALSDKDLRTMERLVRVQNRKQEPEAAAETEPQRVSAVG